MQTVPVILKDATDRSYDILIGEGLLPTIGQAMQKRGLTGDVLIVTNKKLLHWYGKTIIASLTAAGFSVNITLINDSEKTKSLKTAEQLYATLLNKHFDRKSTLVALGGGVIGDLTGYVAANYQRGINFVQVPTTLLSQVDSSVGGKTAVNHRLGKNMIGAFYQPQLVVADTNTLKTLPIREIRSGLAEIIKYGYIYDPKIITFLKKNKALSSKHFQYLIKRSCEIKAFVVSKDEREAGLRAILNFGHTTGHAIETWSKYRYPHGEAVALGMLVALNLSHTKGHLTIKSLTEAEQLLKQHGLPTTITGRWSKQAFIKIMLHDKKVSSKTIRMVLLNKIGKAYVEKITDQHELINALTILEGK